MNLLTKTTLYYVTVSLFVFFIAGIGIYRLLKSLEEKKVRKELQQHKTILIHNIDNENISLEKLKAASGSLVDFRLASSKYSAKEYYIDTLSLDEFSNKILPFKCLKFHTTINGKLYSVSICKPMMELNYLVEQIALTVTLITIIFLLVVYFLYRYFFAKIWSDFFATINKIQHFNPSSPEPIRFQKSMIIEFNELNNVLSKMIERINADFQALREFSGNLSHEIQTPLAVIKSKTNLLIQDSNISENQMRLASNINQETNKISRFIKALALFSKLDYKQFPNSEIIDIEIIINNILNDFEDFIHSKNINLDIETKDSLRLNMNPELADILFTNLIKNAVRHNVQNGKINIKISRNSFTIENTGYELEYDANLLFNRFVKNRRNSKSLGIGLSIVKKICDYYNFEINYLNKEELHRINIQTFAKPITYVH